MSEPPVADTFRDLVQRIQEYAGASLDADVLAPSLDGCARGMRQLAPLRRRGPRRGAAEADVEARWGLYALSRVSDLLLSRADPLRPEEGSTFFSRLGLQRFDGRGPFHPFWHEVVRSRDALERPGDVPEAAGVRITEVRWPGLVYGDLLIRRAGVRVVSHARWIAPTGARPPWLYEAYRRPDREARDLACGWGGNSQWRTRFRLDYAEPAHYVFNWGATHDLGDPASLDLAHAPGQGELARRRELLVHRMLVRPDPTPLDPEDEFPYHDTLVLRRTPEFREIEPSLVVPVAALDG